MNRGWSRIKPQCYWHDQDSSNNCDTDWDCDGKRTCSKSEHMAVGQIREIIQVCSEEYVTRPDICGKAVPSANEKDPDSFQPNPEGYSLVGRGWYDGSESGFALSGKCWTDLKGCAEKCTEYGPQVCQGFTFFPFSSSYGNACCYPKLLAPPANASGLATGNNWDKNAYTFRNDKCERLHGEFHLCTPVMVVMNGVLIIEIDVPSMIYIMTLISSFFTKQLALPRPPMDSHMWESAGMALLPITQRIGAVNPGHVFSVPTCVKRTR